MRQPFYGTAGNIRQSMSNNKNSKNSKKGRRRNTVAAAAPHQGERPQRNPRRAVTPPLRHSTDGYNNLQGNAPARRAYTPPPSPTSMQDKQKAGLYAGGSHANSPPAKALPPPNFDDSFEVVPTATTTAYSPQTSPRSYSPPLAQPLFYVPLQPQPQPKQQPRSMYIPPVDSCASTHAAPAFDSQSATLALRQMLKIA